MIEYVNQEYNTNFALKIQHQIRFIIYLLKKKINGFLCTDNQ